MRNNDLLSSKEVEVIYQTIIESLASNKALRNELSSIQKTMTSLQRQLYENHSLPNEMISSKNLKISDNKTISRLYTALKRIEGKLMIDTSLQKSININSKRMRALSILIGLNTIVFILFSILIVTH